jgi:mannose/fructose-specific phosphotransferase system component IIA
MRLNVVIIAHAGLAEALAEAAEMIAGPQPNLHALNFREGDDMLELGNKLAGMIQNNGADFTLMLTDLYGATPTNAALLAMSKCENSAVVTGANLISVIQALEMNGEDSDVSAVLELVRNESRNGVRIITLEDLYK